MKKRRKSHANWSYQYVQPVAAAVEITRKVRICGNALPRPEYEINEVRWLGMKASNPERGGICVGSEELATVGVRRVAIVCSVVCMYGKSKAFFLSFCLFQSQRGITEGIYLD